MHNLAKQSFHTLLSYGRHAGRIHTVDNLEGEKVGGGGFVYTIDENAGSSGQAIGLDAVTERGWMGEGFMRSERVGLG